MIRASIRLFIFITALVILLISIISIKNYQYLLIKYHIWQLGNATPPLYYLYAKQTIEFKEMERYTIFLNLDCVDFKKRNAKSLLKMGKIVIPYLRGIIVSNQHKPMQKIAAIYIIRELGSFMLKENIDVLMKATEDNEPIVRYNAIDALYEISDNKIVIPVLVSALEDKNIGGAIYGGLEIIQGPITIRGKALYFLDWLVGFYNARSIIGATDISTLVIDDSKMSEIKHNFMKWWDENHHYLYYNTQDEQFEIDERAKAAGISTEEYRKTHPWPKEKESQPKEDTHK